jgi:hypothetical protein
MTQKKTAQSAPGEYLALLEQRLNEKAARPDAGFDPLTIVMIIAVIVPLIQNCRNKGPNVLRRRFGSRAQVATAIYRDCQGVSWNDAFRRADDLFDLADEATDDELRGLIEECRR